MSAARQGEQKTTNSKEAITMSDYPELKTIRDFIRYATTRFNENGLYFGHGTDNEWDEATAIVFHALHLPHSLYANAIDTRVTDEEKDTIIDLIDQRVSRRIPVPYLTNEAWFAGLPFYVDERVLIPRSSIAELIEQHFEPWINRSQVHRILDLCTGSGCIAIACAYAFPDATIDAVDISADALAVAKINCLRHHTEDRISLIESDLFNDLPQNKYDIIVTNPPYVSQEEMDTLPEEYLHEPPLGLEAGEDGLDYVKRILQDANDYLSERGILVVEVGNSEHTLIGAYPTAPFTWIEFEHGEGGVFVLTKDQIDQMTLILSA